jgi:serine/threonine protein kinase
MSNVSPAGASPPSGWRVGDVVENLYEVRQVITSGGMGVVHRVYHRGWNVELAVKTPRPELVSSPSRMADFVTEAEAWVGLGLHPHVVACVYVRRLGGLPRVFAEWVDGGSLRDAIESGLAANLFAARANARRAVAHNVLQLGLWRQSESANCDSTHLDTSPGLRRARNSVSQ